MAPLGRIKDWLLQRSKEMTDIGVLGSLYSYGI